MRLTKTDFPHYFDAILGAELLVAPSAHQATCAFNDTYLIPIQIHSLLDYIVYAQGKPIGIICSESLRRRVNWSEQELIDSKRITHAEN